MIRAVFGDMNSEPPDDLPMFLRTLTEHVSIPNTVDLRLPRAQQWIHRNLTYGIPHTVFQYETGYRADLVIRRDERLLSDLGSLSRISEIINSSRTERKPVFYPSRESTGSLNVVAGVPNDFFGLISFLIFPFRGGSTVTEVIGIWLRRLAARG